MWDWVIQSHRDTGCGSILDRNWGTKNSDLMARKVVFRLEGVAILQRVERADQP
jgi:hypothetical protein